MILQDLFESNMKRVLDAINDLRTLGDTDAGVEEFTRVYGMPPVRWVRAYYPIIKPVIGKYPFLKKYLKAPDAHLFHEENQDDRNARIIAGEIEDAAQQGNDELVKQKIKELIKVGYTLDKDGKLQRMGMYESELEETFIRPETAREQQVQLLARTYAELYWGNRSITAQASTAREIFNAVMSGELDTATLKMEIRALEQEHDISEEQDACYRKVKSRYKVWPSAYASGALVQCRKKGVANWGNKSKK
jgi:hypothetical protein